MPYAHISSGHQALVPFQLESVDEVTAPQGQKGVWQRYVIVQGANRIVGMRAGVRSEVSSLLTQQVDNLNLRLGKRKPWR